MKSLYTSGTVVVFNLCCSVYEGNKCSKQAVVKWCINSLFVIVLDLSRQYSFTHSQSSLFICLIFYSVMDKTLQSVSMPYMGPKNVDCCSMIIKSFKNTILSAACGKELSLLLRSGIKLNH